MAKTTSKDPIQEAVNELWSAEMGINTLLQKVQERLKQKQKEQEVQVEVEVHVEVEVTKPKVKAAKLLIPYVYVNDDDDDDDDDEHSSHSDDNHKAEEQGWTGTERKGCKSQPQSQPQPLSEERIQFISGKIEERQNHRKSRRFQEADRVEMGLKKMGVLLNDANKTWSYRHRGSNGEQENENENNHNGNLNPGSNNEIRCQMCNKTFESRNLVFKHLRDVESDCGNRIFALGSELPTAPSTTKKIEKRIKAKENNILRRRARTGRTADHTTISSSLWVGDIPLPWTRMGGQYKRLRALLRQYLTEDVPQPWVKVVVRKSYRKRSKQQQQQRQRQQQSSSDEQQQLHDMENKSNRTKDEYLGYAIVVFRCDEEAENVKKALDGIQVIPREVFRSGEMNDEQLSQLPSFTLKVRECTMGPDSLANSSLSQMSQMKKNGEDPPLSEQLRPFTIDELKRRIDDIRVEVAGPDGVNKLSQETESKAPNSESEGQKNGQKNEHQKHQDVLNEAVLLYESIGPRKEIQRKGRLVPENIRSEILEILKNLRWQVPNERKHLNAERYLTLPTNVSNDRFYGDLRQACKNLMNWADNSYFYSGIAVTKNFVASPHIDDRDRSFQYAISLGDFQGGELCVEGRNHNEINVVDTKNRIARVDGRHIHWVRGWNGGDRYSLIFYDTTQRFIKPVIETGVCMDYIKNSE